MSQTEEMTNAVKTAIEKRIAACEASGNEAQKRKWQAELKALSLPAYAEAMVELGFKPEQLDSLAIYATQKVRRLLSAYVGAGQPDPYTRTLLDAAKMSAGNLAGKVAMAVLSAKVKVEGEVKNTIDGLVRRSATQATASTQASSTRQALIALGAGRAGEKGQFQVDLEHRLLKTVTA